MTVPHYHMYVNGTWRDAATSLEVRSCIARRCERCAVCICGPDWHT